MKEPFISIDQVPLFLTIEEMGWLLGVSRAGAYAVAHSEGFPLIRLGKRMVVSRDALFEWLDNQSSDT